MRIHSIIEKTRAEGPGTRFCIWVQGCTRHCPGCFNPETWPSEGGREMSPGQLSEMILSTEGIEGISLLGGEPMEQAAELAQVAERAREKGLSVLCFTGYTLEEIESAGDTGMLELLRQTDLLIDGPFILAEKDLSRPWLGSKNQRYHFLSPRYSPADIEKCRNRLEIRLLPDGRVRLNGMADDEVLMKLKKYIESGESHHEQK